MGKVLHAAVYRLGQFWRLLTIRALPPEMWAEVTAVLTPPQQQLFRRLNGADQWHSVQVLRMLRDAGHTHPDLQVAALLHDVGKIGIEDRILKKPAALTEEEYAVMKTHPEKGAKIMAEIPQMKKYIPGMYYHHECIDGRGYPLGLKGDQIPLMARIISVADTFDAMTTNRPYQRAMPTDVAVQKIWSFAGTRYDPNVVAALESALKAGKLDEVIKGYQTALAAGKA